MEVPAPRRNTFWNSLSFKLIITGILILLMLIPGTMIRRLIAEREMNQLEVLAEVGSKWGTGQTLTGPLLSIPYYVYIEDEKKTYRQTEFAHFLPEH